MLSSMLGQNPCQSPNIASTIGFTKVKAHADHGLQPNVAYYFNAMVDLVDVALIT
jgi:hypothetical protein